MSARPADGPSGWVIFAGAILFMAGSLDFFYQLTARWVPASYLDDTSPP